MQWYYELMYKLTVVIKELFEKMCEIVVAEIKVYLQRKAETAIALSYNGNFPCCNNHSDHAMVTYIEQTTPSKFLVHLETTVCSKSLSPQLAKSLLAPKGVGVVEKEYRLPVWILISNGKEIKAFAGRMLGRDLWHKLCNWHPIFVVHVDQQTKCIMGCKKKGNAEDGSVLLTTSRYQRRLQSGAKA